MTIPHQLGMRTIRQGLASLVAVLAISAALLCSMSASSPSTASAFDYVAPFCNKVLDPAWTGDYRCDSPDNLSGYGRDYVWVNTVTRAGCVDYADVWHNLISSWVCTGSNSKVGIQVRQDGGWYRGAIRNNNLSYSGAFSGQIAW